MSNKEFFNSITERKNLVSKYAELVYGSSNFCSYEMNLKLSIISNRYMIVCYERGVNNFEITSDPLYLEAIKFHQNKKQ